jgi:hypothetical protein
MGDDYSFVFSVFLLGVAKIFINIGNPDSGAAMFDAHVVEAIWLRRRPSPASLLNLDIGALVQGAPKQENKPHRSCCRYANELNRRTISQSGGRYVRGRIPSPSDSFRLLPDKERHRPEKYEEFLVAQNSQNNSFQQSGKIVDDRQENRSGWNP